VGALPTGLSLNTSTGAITGKPTATGKSTFTIKVVDKSGATLSHAYAVTINAPLAITTTSLSNWTQNQAGYSQAVVTTGGTTPKIFSVSVGTLPTGLSVNTSTGAITGKPTTTGTSTFTIKVVDKSGATISHPFTIIINAPLAITTTILASGTLNVSGYSQTIATSGGTTPKTFSLLTGTLPAGLSLSATTGAITGKPTLVGTSSFTIKVVDKSGASVTKAFSIKINS
jgi:hypothetical protein